MLDFNIKKYKGINLGEFKVIASKGTVTHQFQEGDIIRKIYHDDTSNCDCHGYALDNQVQWVCLVDLESV